LIQLKNEIYNKKFLDSFFEKGVLGRKKVINLTSWQTLVDDPESAPLLRAAFFFYPIYPNKSTRHR